jgi:hypothetical protein
MEYTRAQTPIELHVLEIPENREEWLNLSKIACDWQGSAKQKIEKRKETKTDSTQFRAAMNIADTITQEITSKLFPAPEEETSDETWDSIFVCYAREQKNIEGIALFSKKTGYLKAIISNPANLKHPLNDASQKISGVGTAIIRKLAGECVAINAPLTLNAYKTAIPFYQRLGFEEVLPGNCIVPPMKLPLANCIAMSFNYPF